MNFTDLGDVPANYTGAASKAVRVKADESGLEFVTVIGPPTVQVSTYQDAEPEASQVLLRYISPEAWTLPGNMVGSGIDVGVAPTATATLTVKKNGVAVGTIDITTGLVYTFATTAGADVSFAVGDILDLTAQGVPDTTLAQIAVTLTGPKV